LFEKYTDHNNLTKLPLNITEKGSNFLHVIEVILVVNSYRLKTSTLIKNSNENVQSFFITHGENMIKLFSPSLFLISGFALAQTPKAVSDIVQLQGPYNATMEQVQKSVVNMYVPDGGVVVIDMTGQDRFLSFSKNTTYLKPEIKSSGKTVSVKSDVDDGYTQTLALETLCGRSVSVNIIGLSSKVTPDTIKPKLLITAPSC